MGKCLVCNEESAVISENLGVCLRCIREHSEKAIDIAGQIHARHRVAFHLPPRPPRDSEGLSCGVCANNCVIGPGHTGFCGLVSNIDGCITRFGGIPARGVLEWYYDSLPTNCVSWWFCPGCTGAGYPQYAVSPEAEYGYSNLAVFYGGCSFDCLYCQNWRHRSLAANHKPAMSAEALASKVDRHVTCICYFGGDPSPQMPHSIEVARIALERAEDEKRVLRVCWETNGYMNPKLAEIAAELALKSGGNIKFDLKTWSEELSLSMCGVSNQPTKENFQLLGRKFYKKRPDLPMLSASTLLVSGYIDSEEVDNIAKFISSIDPTIPYTLLAFYPSHVVDDLPTTRRKQAYECLDAARKHLDNVRLGNLTLLG